MYYLTEEGAEGLKRYKYKGNDRSLLHKYVFKHIWDRLVFLFPDWLAPNLITLIGLAGHFANYALIVYYCPTFDCNPPPWLALSTGLAQLFYVWMDNLDGRQARRTGTGGPLGELFDHGCDALNCTLGFLATSLMLRMSIIEACGIWLSMYIAFFMGTWEEYHTGALVLPEINGAVEGATISQLFLVVAAIYPDFWIQTTLSDLGVPLPFELRNNGAIALVLLLGTFPTIYLNIKGVIEHYKQRDTRETKSPRKMSLRSSKIELEAELEPSVEVIEARRSNLGWDILPLIIFVATAIVIFYQFILEIDSRSEFQFMSHHTHVVFWSIGLCFGLVNTKLTVAHCVQQRYRKSDAALYPIAGLLTAIALALPLSTMIKTGIVWSVFSVLTMVYTHYVYGMINDITSALNIQCLSIQWKLKSKSKLK